VVLLCFGLQQFIFIATRFAVWFFLSVFCLGCICLDDEAPEWRAGDRVAREDPDFDPFAFNVASYNFEKHFIMDRDLGNWNRQDQN